MLVRGNNKLGTIYNWSIPADDTCPGSSDTCRSKCYAKKGTYKFSNVAQYHSRNYHFSKREDFAKKIINYIDLYEIELVRIHAAGDFYDSEYVDKWIEIVSNSTNTKFFTYTRSWNVYGQPEMLQSLRHLGLLSNMTLWLSCDKDTGIPPSWEACPWAYLSLSDEDIPYYKPDLVFRSDRRTYMKKQPETDSLVCPMEQGVKYNNLNCETCKICFNDSGKVLKLFQIGGVVC